MLYCEMIDPYRDLVMQLKYNTNEYPPSAIITRIIIWNYPSIACQFVIRTFILNLQLKFDTNRYILSAITRKVMP